MQWPGARILRRQELDAFLAQALSPKLYEPDQLQELKVTDASLPVLEPCSALLGRLGALGGPVHPASGAAGAALGAFRARGASFPAPETVRPTRVHQWALCLFSRQEVCLPLVSGGDPTPREGSALGISYHLAWIFSLFRSVVPN